MHYHLEIVMPPTDDYKAAVDRILEPFSEHNENARKTFYDWYETGGRWAGSKVTARIGQDIIDAFYQWCRDEEITVSSVMCGKQSLQPPEQIPKVDAKWQEMTGLEGPCLIFQHSGRHGELDGDVCTVGEIQDDFKASHVIIADDEGKAMLMWQDEMWNGVSWQEADWDGTVMSAITRMQGKIERYNDDYRERNTPTDDWLVVTVDYHS